MTSFLGVTCLASLIAYNIACQRVFDWLRAWAHRRCPAKVAEALDCHYCLSHWSAMAVALATGYRTHILPGAVADLLVTVALMIVAAQPLMVAIDWTIDAMNSFGTLFLYPRRRGLEEDHDVHALP